MKCRRPLILGVALTALIVAVPAHAIFQHKGSTLRWPNSPTDAKVAYVGEFHDQATWGKPQVPWYLKVWRLITGNDPQYRMVSPSAVASSGTKLYVADADAEAVWLADEKSMVFTPFLGDLAGRQHLDKPMALQVDARGRLFIADADAARVVIVTAQGKPAGRIAGGGLRRPAGLALDDQAHVLYVADSAAHVIRYYDAETLKPLGTFGKRGGAPGEFNYPAYLAFRGSYLYVVDTFNFRVQVFDRRHHFVRAFGRLGDGYGDFARPKGIAVDHEGNTWVVDGLFANVQIFDREGRLLLFFGGHGQGEARFWLPQGLFMDAHNRVFVADAGNHRVQVFQFLGKGND